MGQLGKVERLVPAWPFFFYFRVYNESTNEPATQMDSAGAFAGLGRDYLM